MKASPKKSSPPAQREAATRGEEATTASIDQGAEVATREERETPADDYEANARLDDVSAGADFEDDQDTYDRPDSAAIAREEEEEEEE
ncbi:hypothetical protein OKA05_07130 [Luteolibacter arcticus]|uniref:Uncharacterized protein n=1 Tax=Luteolibacter arcticus TaxID=1581411 RepID=A0ABT3GFD8_9BACT|nr:hypothetical protein [Luteolibacter arcticus]MCW1922321.1 hypothetical protein [Luteolibacter arcticus]